jgi:hypothetical protein
MSRPRGETARWGGIVGGNLGSALRPASVDQPCWPIAVARSNTASNIAGVRRFVFWL